MASNSSPWQTHSKMIFLLTAWFCSMAFMATESEKKIHHKLLSIDEFETKSKVFFIILEATNGRPFQVHFL